MFKHKDKKKTIILVVSSILILVLLIGGGIFCWKSGTKNQVSNNNSNNLPPENPSNNSKDLAEKIKTDLKERIKRIKNSKTKPDPNDWNPYMVFDDRISCVAPDIGFLKQKDSVFPSQVGTENYQEIVNLIKQAKQARDEWIIQKNQEAEQKLAVDPKLFYNAYETSFSGEVGPFPNWGFTGKKNGQKFCLIIPKNHPTFNNFSIPRGGMFLYYRITGIENLPLVPSPMDGTGLYKIVKLTDQITIENYKP
jgi:hypothetical protein